MPGLFDSGKAVLRVTNDTCDAILDIAVEHCARQDPAKDGFEIIDEQRNILMQVPFSEVLRPAAATNMPRKLETIR